MVELGAVPTLCQIALTPSETLAELPLKASILPLWASKMICER